MDTSDSNIPETFRSSIVDFTNDLSTTFPEFAHMWTKWASPEAGVVEFKQLFDHCSQVFPERFFDILNQNAAIFAPDSKVNTVFLPNIDFKLLYNCEGISDRTKETLWKYLQVILLILVNSIKDKVNFGETLGMFDNLEEGDLHAKLQDAMSNIGKFFDQVEQNGPEADAQPSSSKTAGLPKMEELHGHLQGLFDGKIGKLAKELAEDMSGDIAASFGADMEGMTSTKDVLSKLMQNPQKIKNVVNTVREKLASKMESGDISREDLMKEASEMMKKMNGLGGEGGLADMFKNLTGGTDGGEGGLADMFKNLTGGADGGGMGDMFKNMAKTMGMNIPAGARVDTNAMNQEQQKTTAKERLKARAQAKNQAQFVKQLEEQAREIQRKKEYDEFMAKNPNIFDSSDPNSLVYRLDGEKQEKSSIRPDGEMSASKKKRLKEKAKKEKASQQSA